MACPKSRGGVQRRGFTLVELLVVIGIIAVLISILLPVLNKAREQAKAIVCASNEKQLLASYMMYLTDHKGATPIFPPVEGTWPTSKDPFHHSFAYYEDDTGNVGGRIRYDKGAFWPYVTSALHYVPTTGNKQGIPPEVLFRVFNCPSDVFGRDVERGGNLNIKIERNFTYSWNAQFYCDPKPPLGTNGPITWQGKVKDVRPVSRATQIIEGAHKIILEEEEHANDGWAFVGFPGGNSDDLPSWRHTGRGNYGFADGHVESLAPSDIGYTTPFHYNDKPTVLPGAAGQSTTAYYFHLQSNAY